MLNFPNIFGLAAIYTWAPAFKNEVCLQPKGYTGIAMILGNTENIKNTTI